MTIWCARVPPLQLSARPDSKTRGPTQRRRCRTHALTAPASAPLAPPPPQILVTASGLAHAPENGTLPLSLAVGGLPCPEVAGTRTRSSMTCNRTSAVKALQAATTYPASVRGRPSNSPPSLTGHRTRHLHIHPPAPLQTSSHPPAPLLTSRLRSAARTVPRNYPDAPRCPQVRYLPKSPIPWLP